MESWALPHDLVAEAACGLQKDGRYTHHNQTTTPHQARAADYDITCRPDEYTVWEEWRNCIIQYLQETRWTKGNEGGASPCNVSRNLPAVNSFFTKVTCCHGRRLQTWQLYCWNFVRWTDKWHLQSRMRWTICQFTGQSK